MNKLDEFLNLNELTEIYNKNRSLFPLPFPVDDVEENNLLACSFYWYKSEEGFDFWQSVNNDFLT